MTKGQNKVIAYLGGKTEMWIFDRMEKPLPSPYLIRKPKLQEAAELSRLIIESVNHFHTSSYTDEEIAIWHRGYSPAKMETQISKGGTRVLEVAGALAGVIQFDAPEIKGFYLRPTYSGQGWGRVLLDHVLSQIKTEGHRRVELTSNKMAAAFYKKLGFQMVGEEMVYWENHPFVEYRMVRSLG
ncbi:MAG: GNAT family N-acetyltransferase [Bacteroidota bacterium]